MTKHVTLGRDEQRSLTIMCHTAHEQEAHETESLFLVYRVGRSGSQSALCAALIIQKKSC